MKQLVKYEFRKIWTKLTIISVISLVLVGSVLNISSFFSTIGVVNNAGEELTNLSDYRVLREESKDIKGSMNQKYLDKLIKEFNSSNQKKNFGDVLHFLYSKYRYSNYIINFANYGKDMDTGKIMLDFNFIKSEKDFYDTYKQSMKDTIKFDNQKNWFIYNEKQLNKINKKIDNLKTPFKVDYYEGLDYFGQSFSSDYWLVLIPIGFALSSLFSKDSNNGIDELTLSAKYGRNKNMNARVIAGNIFAVLVYLIFVFTYLIEHGLVFSLKGGGQSIQNIWYTCFYNISLGMGIFIMILKGIVPIVLVSNLVMLISIIIKYSKLSTILSIFSILSLIRLTYTNNSLQLQLNPIYYGMNTEFSTFYFIGDIMIPYILAFVGIALLYLLTIRLLTKYQYKKYKIN